MALRVDCRLPPLTGKRLRRVRLDLLERGFTLVTAPPVFEDRLLPRLRRRRTVLPAQDRRWWQFPPLARYAYWLEELLRQALPEEAIALAALEFRHEPAGSEDGDVDRLHADGSYLRAVTTLYGPSTVYRDGRAERSVPPGRTLLLTAMDRARALKVPCTLHRRPGLGPERAVLVCSFTPRQGQPEAAPVYQQAAATRRPRER
jgi:hypothetical protein